MEHFLISGLIVLALSNLASSKEKCLMETPDCSSCIWEWNSEAFFRFNPVVGTWYHPSGTFNRYHICNLNNFQEPNSWLRSYVIEVGDIERLDVTFRYLSHQCDPPGGLCKEYFYAYVWESNTSVTEGPIPHPINDFQLYRIFANITRQSDQETNLTVPLQVTSKYIVLAIRDQGGCRILYSVKVSYKVCGAKTLEDSLVTLPSISAQVESTPLRGNCTVNSVQIVPGYLTVICDSNGEWNTIRLKSRCVCKEGFENIAGCAKV